MEKLSNVDRWLERSCGSKATRDRYARALEIFSEKYGVDPEVLIEQWKQSRYDWKLRETFIDNWTERVDDFYVSLKEYTPLSKHTMLTAILSYFNFYDAKLKVKEDRYLYVKFHNRSLTREEIKRILENSNVRDRAFFLVALESGLRPETIANLQYKYIKVDFEKEITPMSINVPAEIVKDHVGNRTSFIGVDGFNALKEYLSSRMPLRDNDYLFVNIKRAGGKDRATRGAFSMAFNKIVQKLKIETPTEKRKPKSVRLYSLRKWFRNNIGIDSDLREYFMGHTLKVDAHYIDRNNIEKYREIYAKAYSNVRITQPEKVVSLSRVEELEAEIIKRDEKLKDLEERLNKKITEEINRFFDEYGKKAKLTPKQIDKFVESENAAIKSAFKSLMQAKNADEMQVIYFLSGKYDVPITNLKAILKSED